MARRTDRGVTVSITNTRFPKRMTLDEARAAQTTLTDELVRNGLALTAAIESAERNASATV